MAEQTENTEPQIQIHKIYVKDMSLQIPEGSNTFRAEWKPELNVEIDHQSKALAEADTYEVTLRVKCLVNNQDKLAFEVEVFQAGIFTATDFENDTLEHALGSFCPNMLYPYLREAVSDAVMKAGFPQLSLAPINFDMLYEQQKAQGQTAESSETRH